MTAFSPSRLQVLIQAYPLSAAVLPRLPQSRSLQRIARMYASIVGISVVLFQKSLHHSTFMRLEISDVVRRLSAIYNQNGILAGAKVHTTNLRAS